MCGWWYLQCRILLRFMSEEIGEIYEVRQQIGAFSVFVYISQALTITVSKHFVQINYKSILVKSQSQKGSGSRSKQLTFKSICIPSQCRQRANCLQPSSHTTSYSSNSQESFSIFILQAITSTSCQTVDLLRPPCPPILEIRASLSLRQHLSRLKYSTPPKAH